MNESIKMQWIETPIHSRLYGQGLPWSSAIALCRSEVDGQWYCKTPPLFGKWATREEGKAAIVNQLQENFTILLLELKPLETEGHE